VACFDGTASGSTVVDFSRLDANFWKPVDLVIIEELRGGDSLRFLAGGGTEAKGSSSRLTELSKSSEQKQISLVAFVVIADRQLFEIEFELDFASTDVFESGFSPGFEEVRIQSASTLSEEMVSQSSFFRCENSLLRALERFAACDVKKTAFFPTLGAGSGLDNRSTTSGIVGGAIAN
jgi:hypothetical protein